MIKSIRFSFVMLFTMSIFMFFSACGLMRGSGIPQREPDIPLASVIENSEENGNLVLLLQSEKMEQALVTVDQKTKIYIGNDTRNLTEATREQLLKANHVTVWFKEGSKVDSDPVKATAEVIAIDD